MTPEPARASRSFWKAITRFEAGKVDVWMAVRNAAGVALPLACGVAFGMIPSGLAAATGALNVAFSDDHDPYLPRARRMLAATALVGWAVFAGAISGSNGAAAVALAGVWAFGAGMLVALSSAAADLGAMSLVVLVVYAAAGLTPQRAFNGGLLALAGGLIETGLALGFWPLRRYDAERRALGQLYIALADAAGSHTRVLDEPPANAESTSAEQTLGPLATSHSIEAERYRLLFGQAERMRLALLAIRRLYDRAAEERPKAPELELMDDHPAACSRLLGAIGEALVEGKRFAAPPGFESELNGPAERLRAAESAWPPLRDARAEMDALSGQIRAAMELAAAATPAGSARFRERDLRRPWYLRVRDPLATLRANLSLQSAAFRHAIRLAICVAAGDAAARAFGLERSYWVPMTIAIVLKPDFTTTFSRGVLRLAGTFLGLSIATALFHVLAPTPGMEVVSIAALMFLMRWLGPANYGITVTAVTGLVVLMIAMTGVEPKQVIMVRGWDTLGGGAIALLAYWLWPTWERTLTPEALARMLDAYRVYFRTVADAYLNLDRSYDWEMERARIAARRARSNLEASFDRLSAEPGTPPDSVRTVSAALASSHRWIHAVMALEAGLSASAPAPARPQLKTFARDVDLTLYYLAAALRGSPIGARDLPDLREDHHALVHAEHAAAERYTLVNEEMDRITNSLNTLSEALIRWPDRTGVRP
jgi:uncharacterized membrane protein YccC